MTPKSKARSITAIIIFTMGLFGAVCHWKPAYGLIIFLSTSFTCTVFWLYNALSRHFTQHEHHQTQADRLRRSERGR